MIDTHCHLDYLDDPEIALNELGLTGTICIGADSEHAQAAIALAEQHSHVWAAIGLHPIDADQDSEQTRKELEELSLHPQVVGIGEAGLDFYWDKTTREQQFETFAWQLDLAKRRELPIIVHTRDKQGQEEATLECINMLQGANWQKGIIHCFNGHTQLMRAALDLGFYIGFAGNVTYKNAQTIREAARFVPHDRLLVETDAPFLAPVPKRGQSNRPGYVRYTLNFLAEWLNLPATELERITDENAKRAFQLPI